MIPGAVTAAARPTWPWLTSFTPPARAATSTRKNVPPPSASSHRHSSRLSAKAAATGGARRATWPYPAVHGRLPGHLAARPPPLTEHAPPPGRVVGEGRRYRGRAGGHLAVSRRSWAPPRSSGRPLTFAAAVAGRTGANGPAVQVQGHADQQWQGGR